MFNVCLNCAEYRADKTVEKREAHSVAICPLCGHEHAFTPQPLLIICGASGVGKTTTELLLPALLADHVVTIEGDIALLGQAIEPYTEAWLRICKSISRSGRPVLLCANGLIPPNVEPRVERRYFSDVHYLAFTCDPTEQAARLNARPAWRGTDWQEQIRFNNWIREESRLELLDTTNISIEESAEKVKAWVLRCLESTEIVG